MVSTVWVTDILVPNGSPGSISLYLMVGFIYLVDEWFLKMLVYKWMAHVSRWLYVVIDDQELMVQIN